MNIYSKEDEKDFYQSPEPFIKVRVQNEDADSTLSQVYINGNFSFYSIEDEYREIKVKGETRVDAGTYPLALRYSPKFSNSYLVNPNGSYEIVNVKKATGEQKLWQPHQLIWIKDTPRHEFILIHWGNTESDTDGCLVIGNKAGKIGDKLAVLESRLCYETWYPVMAKEIFKGGKTLMYDRK
jgi:hypothetical protein